MPNRMKKILRENGLELVNSKKDKVTKIFGDTTCVGVMIGDVARFTPSLNRVPKNFNDHR